MRFLQALIRNHPLANILFLLVLFTGAVSYFQLPREQDPEINFNWVNITTVLPGATSEDVERLVTNPLEDAIKGVSDLRFVISNSRENVSSILVRFLEIDERTFDKRITDLRREVQNRASAELPEEIVDPRILEITTSNGFPTALLVLQGQANDESLRRNGRLIKADLERIKGVDSVFAYGLRDPEIQVRFNPTELAARGMTATDLSDALRAWFRDTAAGTLRTSDSEWLIRLSGQTVDPEAIAQIPIVTNSGVTALVGDVATVDRARSDAAQLAIVDGKPAVTLAINKKSNTNTIKLVGKLTDYVQSINPKISQFGLALSVADDQTIPTRAAISVMQRNALQGLALVMLVCFVFLGLRIAVLVGLGIMFSLAGTFIVLNVTGFTLNISVLLGIVISLGMLVDDAVVVVEAIYYRIERGQQTLAACLAGVAEVWRPVLASVLTTIAAFLPLMLMPGIVGKFMFVIPFVVTVALLISLIEAFWMVPAHVDVARVRLSNPGRVQRWRNAFNQGLRRFYSKALIKALRHPLVTLLMVALLLAGVAGAFAAGKVKVQFFAFDSLRIFYVNVDMPPSASLEQTSAELARVEKVVRSHLKPGEQRSVISVAGQKFTETEPLFGDSYGQVIVPLLAREEGGRFVSQVIDSMREDIMSMGGPSKRSFLQISGGPPSTKPVSVKVRSDDYDQLRAAVNELLQIVRDVPGTVDVVDDDVAGRPELTLQLNAQAVRDLGLNAGLLARTLRLAVDGEVVSVIRDNGDRIELRVQAQQVALDDVAAVLQMPVALPSGGTTHLGAVVDAQTRTSRGVVRHYNLRRSITVEADFVTDENGRQSQNSLTANKIIGEQWDKISTRYPAVNLEFGGELEDVQESLNALKILFPIGVGLMYLILAAQFGSYFQPLLMLSTVFLALAGVTIGLVISGNPLSLFTMYGAVALTGITVNSAIVLTDAINSRREAGLQLIHAVVLAARRRVVPVLITSLTTIAGLFSLALGLGGKSLLWGPVASSIVWGLGVATMLTLFVIPILYVLSMRFGGYIDRLGSRIWARVRSAGKPIGKDVSNELGESGEG